MKKNKKTNSISIGILIVVLLLIVAGLSLYLFEPEYAYIPPSENVEETSFGSILATENAEDQSFLKLGRESFYQETFGNEVFFTDIMGLFDGPISFQNITKALMQLNGRGTTNLKVELAEAFTVGDKNIIRESLSILE